MPRQIYYKLGECWEAKQGENYSQEAIEIEIGEGAWQGKGDMTETVQQRKRKRHQAAKGRKVCAQQRMCICRV